MTILSVTARIVELIQRRPSIRQVEIADQIDLDMDEVRRLLEPYINDGSILVGKVIAPNGRTVDAYRINPEFSPRLPAPPAENVITPRAAPVTETKPMTTPENVGLVDAKSAKRKPGRPRLPKQFAVDPGKSQFCCGLFSDGRLVLDLDGKVMTLNQHATAELVRYLNRVAGDVEAAE